MLSGLGGNLIFEMRWDVLEGLSGLGMYLVTPFDDEFERMG